LIVPVQYTNIEGNAKVNFNFTCKRLFFRDNMKKIHVLVIQTKVQEFLEDFGLEQENYLVENFRIDLTN